MDDSVIRMCPNIGSDYTNYLQLLLWSLKIKKYLDFLLAWHFSHLKFMGIIDV